MNKIINFLLGVLRYGLATLILASSICLALVSGAMTFVMYTSNYNQEDIRYIITGGLAVAMQIQVFFLSIGMPIIRQYAPQHVTKTKVLLYISFFLSVIGSISFFTNQNEYSVGVEPIYNEVIRQFVDIFTFGLLDNMTNTFQTIIGIWAICFFVEFLVIFLPNLSISIFTGKYQKIINNGLSIKDFIIILIFSSNRKKDIKKFINIYLNPSIKKIEAKLNEANNTKFLTQKKKVIDLKVNTPNEKVITQNKNGSNSNSKSYNPNEKGYNSKQKGTNSEEKVITINEKVSTREQLRTNYNLIKTYINDKYKADEIIKKQEVITKFQLSPKKWQRVLTKLKEESIIYTKGTTSFKKGLTKNKKELTKNSNGSNLKNEKVVTDKNKN